MMIQIIKKLPLIIILLMTSSCEGVFIADTPSYINLTSFTYNGDNISEPPHPNEYNSTNITDSWISMDGEIIGVFEIPATIPILSDGIHSFDIYPGIKVNGISGNRTKYPFYTKFETELELERDMIISITPTTTYSPETLFYFEEQGKFEMLGTMFEKSTLSDTNAIIQNDVVFQGSHSLAIFLDSMNNYFDIRNINELELPNNTFLELNFKSNIDFNIGVIIINTGSIDQKEELIQLYASTEWKKIYLELAPLLNMGNSNSKFKIYIDGNYNNNYIFNSIYIDNFKLVYN
mgnify:CR=1 FL=1